MTLPDPAYHLGFEGANHDAETERDSACCPAGHRA